jgi:uncharacterized protein
MDKKYHSGEITIQEMVAEKEIASRNGKVISNKIIPGAINFIEKQPFFIASSQDQHGRIAVSALAGKDGFVRVIGESTLEIDSTLSFSNPLDLFWSNIQAHQNIGLLFLEPSTRRRFRINGALSDVSTKLVLSINQAYPNCPKYIQQRNIRPLEKPLYREQKVLGHALSPTLIDLVKSADTFFVGSSDEHGNMDASHRGGLPGFVQVENETTLLIPDYQGNSMFNTLGNFVVNPRGSLLFIDFENNVNVQLSGLVKLHFNSDHAGPQTGGTGRYWSFTIQDWELFENLKGFQFEFLAYSSYNPK